MEEKKEKPKIIRVGSLECKGWHRLANEVLSGGGICTAITTQSNNLLQKVLVEDERRK